MLVVGGTYHEACEYPEYRDLLGSGMRAAAALTALSPNVVLHSCIEEEGRDAARAIAAGYGVNGSWVSRNEAVGFSYFTPLSSPTISGRLAMMVEPLRVQDTTVLVFGMVESGDVTAEGERIVLDPQQPRDLRQIDLSKLGAPEIAVVANATETRQLGGDQDLWVAARTLREQTGVVVVVTKRGAQGALVTTAAEQRTVGSFPTNRVWPIGSGDVFAAVFAHAWGEQRMNPVDAARFASAGAACWCESMILPIDPEDIAARESGETGPTDVTVYLAAPFFNLAQRWLVELTRESLKGLGAEVFSPFHDVGRGSDEVAVKDLEGLDRSSAVLGLLDGGDEGTLFEVGWATKGSIPVIGYTEYPDAEATKMIRGSGGEITGDLSTAVYRAIWAGMRGDG